MDFSIALAVSDPPMNASDFFEHDFDVALSVETRPRSMISWHFLNLATFERRNLSLMSRHPHSETATHDIKQSTQPRINAVGERLRTRLKKEAKRLSQNIEGTVISRKERLKANSENISRKPYACNCGVTLPSGNA